MNLLGLFGSDRTQEPLSHINPSSKTTCVIRMLVLLIDPIGCLCSRKVFSFVYSSSERAISAVSCGPNRFGSPATTLARGFRPNQRGYAIMFPVALVSGKSKSNCTNVTGLSERFFNLIDRWRSQFSSSSNLSPNLTVFPDTFKSATMTGESFRSSFSTTLSLTPIGFCTLEAHVFTLTPTATKAINPRPSTKLFLDKISRIGIIHSSLLLCLMGSYETLVMPSDLSIGTSSHSRHSRNSSAES